MDWLSEIEAFLANKPLLKARKVSIDDSTMADRALPRLNREKLGRLKIEDVSYESISKNLDKFKNRKTESKISPTTLERYISGFLKVLGAYREYVAERPQKDSFCAMPMPPKIKEKEISAKGKKSIDGRLNNSYLSNEDFEQYCGVEIERYKKFRSGYPPKGAISKGEIKKSTINGHLDGIRNFLGFALKQQDLGYTKDDLCFAICLDTEVLERWEKELALSKGEKNRQGTFLNASNNISALLSGNTGFIAQADKIFVNGPVFQKYLRINQKIMIRERSKDFPGEVRPDPGLPFIKLIANAMERNLIERLEKEGDTETLTSLVTDISIKHFKEACRLQYSPMKSAYKKSLKASQAKDKEKDGALSNVGKIVNEPMPLKTVRDMVHRMYLSVDPNNLKKEQWNCARAMAIFCFMSAFPLRAKNISSLLLARHNSDFEHMYRTHTHWKVKIPASRLKNSYNNVEMDLPEDCNIYLDLWANIRTRYKNNHIKNDSFFGFKPIFDDDEKSSTNGLGEFIKTWSRRFLQDVYSTVEFEGELKKPVPICPNGINPHGMRHIVATNCKKNGVDLSTAAQLLLDDPDTVFKHYMHQKLGESLKSYYDTPAYKNSLSLRKLFSAAS